MRYREIDILKGLAMLLVMLGHSYLQVPFNSLEVSEWSMWLHKSIYSFHMPLFFVVSGFLFYGSSDKDTGSVIKKKAIKLLIPYLFVTLIVMTAKLFAPDTMADNSIGTGFLHSLKFIFIDCGNRWFVYILFIVFLLAQYSNIRKMGLGATLLMMVLCFVIVSDFTFGVNVVDYTLRFAPFFGVGFFVRQYYASYLNLMKQKSFVFGSTVCFLVLNVALIPFESQNAALMRVLLPFSGVNMAWIVCWYLGRVGEDNAAIRFVLHIGKYSLQYYLLLFPVALLGYVIGVKLQVADAALITLMMFVGQIIFITLLVEITRRIPILKYPLGY